MANILTIIPMGKPHVIILMLCYILSVAAATPSSEGRDEQDDVSTYIVHVMPAHAPHPTYSKARLTRAYTSFVHELLPTNIGNPAPRLLYSYAHAMTGFAARLTARQAEHLEAQPSIAAVIRETVYELHTTLSSSFLNLSSSFGIQAESNGGTDAVIAVLDTGIYPKDRASFAADPSLPPTPPPSFHGSCVSTPDFNANAYCNNKLVGAKMFYHGYEAAIKKPMNETEESKSPLDTDGHGTHCASTAAGSVVPDANLMGFARGAAKGTAPGARIAVYKVCWKTGCFGADIVAAINEAIADGVDVISMSLGTIQKSLLDDIDLATFNAVRNGIVVVASAGNNGPFESTLGNVAPWVLTVGASSMNRQFQTVIYLGNGQSFIGTSLYPGNLYGYMKPLILGDSAGSAYCEIGRLDANKVAGKIVLCQPGVVGDADKGVAVHRALGEGVIIFGLSNQGEYIPATAHLIPGTQVSYADGMKIKEYIDNTYKPVGEIFFLGTVIGSLPSSPRIAAFSSHGPSIPTPDILKPDLVAPGVNILAAWTGDKSPTRLDADPRRVEFNIISGTSMATPHVSGIAALLKKARPSWSPAMIMSALMTTAYGTDNDGDEIKDMATGEAAGPFELGSGHVDPNSALDPGLVYDSDYIDFLCWIMASSKKNISGIDCSTRVSITGAELNRPSFSVAFKEYGENITLQRTVRNVGNNINAVYTVSSKDSAPPGTQLIISPGELVFDAEHQTRTYTIVFKSTLPSRNFTKYTHGSVVWSDGVHNVRSPIAVTWPSQSGTISAI